MFTQSIHCSYPGYLLTIRYPKAGVITDVDVDNYLVQFLADPSSSSRHAAEESDINPGAGADNVTGHSEARLHRN